MSWSYRIFSSLPLDKSQAVVNEFERILQEVEESQPTFMDDHECPMVLDICKVARAKGLEGIREQAKKSKDKKISDRFGEGVTMVELDSFTPETSPAGVSVLTFLVENLSPCVVHYLDGFRLDTVILKELGALKSLGPIEALAGGDDVADDEPEEDTGSPLDALRGALMDLLEIASDDAEVRVEIEKQLTRAPTKVREFLNMLVKRPPTGKQADVSGWPKEMKDAFEAATALVTSMRKSIE